MKKSLLDNLIIIAILFAVINQYNLDKVVFSMGMASAFGSKIILEKGASQSDIVAAILPKDKDKIRPYNWKGRQVSLSAQTEGNGYDMLVDMDLVISENTFDESKRIRYRALTKSIYHPCCDSPLSDCGCKHAVAAKGLLKFALLENWSDEQILDEVFLWNRYWWPKHYATAAVYLSANGVNPSDISAKEWLSSKLSTIRAGRKMQAKIGN